MWAVLPLKHSAAAKQRLAGALAPAERRELFLAMAEDVLAALARARGLRGVAVVTGDPAAAALARRYGARVLPEGDPRGHSGAVEAAAAALAGEGAADLLALPGDVPLATADEIDAVLAAHAAASARTPRMTIAPARDDSGSNALALSPPGAIPYRFGADSFRRHLAEARRANVAVRVIRLPGLALDVDTPADLQALLARPAATRAHALLAARCTHSVGVP